MGGWTLLIDFGAASTVAATLEGGDLRVIDFDGAPSTPSAVYWNESRGAARTACDRAGPTCVTATV